MGFWSKVKKGLGFTVKAAPLAALAIPGAAPFVPLMLKGAQLVVELQSSMPSGSGAQKAQFWMDVMTKRTPEFIADIEKAGDLELVDEQMLAENLQKLRDAQVGIVKSFRKKAAAA